MLHSKMVYKVSQKKKKDKCSQKQLAEIMKQHFKYVFRQVILGCK